MPQPKLGARTKDDRVGINLRDSKRGVIGGNLASMRDATSSRALLTPTGRDRKSTRPHPKGKAEESSSHSGVNGHQAPSIRKGGDTHGVANLSMAPMGLALRNNRPEHTMVSVDPKKPLTSEKTRLTQRAVKAETELEHVKAKVNETVAAAVAAAEAELADAKDTLEQRQAELLREKELHKMLDATMTDVEGELSQHFHDAETAFEAQRARAETFAKSVQEAIATRPPLAPAAAAASSSSPPPVASAAASSSLGTVNAAMEAAALKVTAEAPCGPDAILPPLSLLLHPCDTVPAAALLHNRQDG